ncbi:hypothetical protein CVS47_02756 [Microbacterium lemovicicum]|jgi:hypothetical protein|uniref:Protein-tyrosine-phosphatase-like N-terminal domain-containing protein n=1 Tax=Microbacterium lemovicicum TaxID=1072463 RepID=A0A3Q9J017_9MICO|nr:hypothetical protein [Microbacterium lemovicicum]AZS38105.1 hypothetical protein CVS47_02756 [Microbacterium lemovicicum]
MPHRTPEETVSIEEIAERLRPRFPEVPEETVRSVVEDSFDELHDAHVRDFVAVLVEKQAKKRLKAL